MKRFWIFCVICLCMTGCGRAEQPADGEKLQIVTSNFPLYDFVRQIGGEEVEVRLLLPPGTESHSFEPTPQDMIAIQKADLFCYIGGESEAWVSELLKADRQTNGLALLSAVPVLEEETREGMESGSHREHEAHAEADEHIWTSPVNAITMTRVICDALCEKDPAHEELYQSNQKAYEEQLSQLDREFRETVAQSPRREIIFGDRFPFLYFVREYGLSYYAAFPGCAAQAEPSAATLAFLIDKVKQDHVPTVFYLELSNQSIANAVAEAAGAKTALFHSCHNVSREEFRRGESYLSLMTQNVTQLKEALRQ